MTVIVNGKKHEVAADTSIQDLLVGLNIDGSALVVQRNDDIIEKAEYGTIQLDENDILELIQFVGGG